MNYLSRYLKDIVPVAFEMETAKEFQFFGTGPAQFKIKIKREIPRTELLKSTSLALGEAYMKGDIELDRDLYEVLDMFMGNMNRFKTNKLLLRRLLHTSGSRARQRKEVTRHYDIGNDFYRLWLDETMSYSCGYFQNPADSLFEAQVQKVDHILEKLQLKRGMTLLDIGCGWGFLLKRAVEHYGVKGVGITLSEEQYQHFSAEIREQHKEKVLRVKKMDYRDLANSRMSFDRVVSVGMLEHVGRRHYKEFMAQVDGVLKPEGLFLLHFISAQQEHPGDPWIRKYIFPGGTIPSLREIMALLPEYEFHTLSVESLRLHYVKTLQCWRRNFLKHREEIGKVYGAEFVRMWDLYLASCAATFHNGVIDLHQILMSKGVNNQQPAGRNTAMPRGWVRPIEL